MLISGIGMITSVGRSYPDSCASIRAGIVRPHAVDDYLLVEEDTQGQTPLIGHAIQGVSEGFFAAGLWVRLTRLALEELLKSANAPTADDVGFWNKTALLSVTPDPNHPRFDCDEDLGKDFAKNHLLKIVVSQLALPVSEVNMFSVQAGYAGLFRAISSARAPLESGRFERVIVLSVDSLLDDVTLAWLDVNDRLKSPARASGLAPGEAAVVLMLEREETCLRRSVKPLAAVAGVGFHASEKSETADSAKRGKALSQSIRQALSSAGVPAPFAGDAVTDLNGEVWKALEYAGARMHLKDILSDDLQFEIPCASVGDVGSAMAGVNLAFATWSFARNTARSHYSLVTAVCDSGDTGAVCLSRVN
jgi:3-oxoacyl-[acyl-carrier-protein] synthase-1